MEGSDRSPWFVGDLADPWVLAIAGAIPRSFRLACPGDLPETWPVDGRTPPVVVIHRAVLNATDAQRVVRLKTLWEPSPRVVLCVGPHARYVDVERWSRLVDLVVAEATAPDTIARQTSERVRPVGPRPRVAVVSSSYEIRVTLADACRAGGFVAEPMLEGDEVPAGIPVAWDVPVLTPDWPARLAVRARTSDVIALMGFADRKSVVIAQEHGASICLDLPCDVDDLIDAFDRLTVRRPFDPPHPQPPAPFLEAGTGRRHPRAVPRSPRGQTD